MKVEIGDSIPEWTMESVRPERMRTVAAILRDPNPIHWDESASEALGLGRRTVNQSPTNLGYILNMLMAWAGPTCVRRIRVGFARPVYGGDHVTACGKVTGLSLVEGTTVAECEVWLMLPDGHRAIDGKAFVSLPQ